MEVARQAQGVDPCSQGASLFVEAQAGHREIQPMNCWTEAQIKPILPVCCFCQKIRDDTGTEVGQGIWQDLQVYLVARKLRSEDISFSHTYCRACLKDDPRAIALTHSEEPRSSVRDNG